MKNILIPANVPETLHETFQNNYTKLTKKTDHAFIFAADQKMEHLNQDFSPAHFPHTVQTAAQLFELAQHPSIGLFATHVGLIARYAPLYPGISYVAKLNGKTNSTTQEPYSKQLWSVQEALALTHAHIAAVGYTIYLGSDYEQNMLVEAAHIVAQAHAHGLLAILWIYARGKAIKDEASVELVSGAAGVAASLGADFVKLKMPTGGPACLEPVIKAAGNTKVLISGGQLQDHPEGFITEAYESIHTGNAAGLAVGRNIFQHPTKTAQALIKTLSCVIYDGLELPQALSLFRSLN